VLFKFQLKRRHLVILSIFLKIDKRTDTIPSKNHNTLHLKPLNKLENKADLGIAFDGDGDRLMMVDSNGELVDGDELVFIIDC
jgi:phosphomannomutase